MHQPLWIALVAVLVQVVPVAALSTSDKVALGLGLPASIAAVLGIWFKLWEKKRERESRMENNTVSNSGGTGNSGGGSQGRTFNIGVGARDFQFAPHSHNAVFSRNGGAVNNNAPIPANVQEVQGRHYVFQHAQAGDTVNVGTNAQGLQDASYGINPVYHVGPANGGGAAAAAAVPTAAAAKPDGAPTAAAATSDAPTQAPTQVS